MYAVNVDWERQDAVPYLVTYLEPPATNYQIEAPPGDYQVVARFDTDPLSVGGYIMCSTAACTPYLTVLRLNAGRNMSGVDIAGWGSRYAAQLLLHIDLFGSPIPSPELSSPSPTAQDTTQTASPLPVRQLPHGPTPALPAPHEFPSYYFQSSHLTIRVDLPSDWHEIQEPLPSPTDTTYYFVNEDVQSPMSLDSKGVFLVLREYPGCFLNLTGATAQAGFFNTPQGMAHLYFRDPQGTGGRQPFHGFEYFGTKEAGGGCFYLDFKSVTEPARESNLLLFDQIIFQARYQ